MARRVYFSFHYDDIWKVNQIRNSHIVEGCTAAGFMDASLWEQVRRRGDVAVQRAILQGLENTSITCVLIGKDTWQRKYVRYEIEQSLERGNGLIGVHIHNIRDQWRQTSAKGRVPSLLREVGAPIYSWNRARFGEWIERAASQNEPDKPKGFLDWLFS
jgi:hypothetical protein